jgi:hypothetical protein
LRLSKSILSLDGLGRQWIDGPQWTKVLEAGFVCGSPWLKNSSVRANLGRGRVKTLIVVVAGVASEIMGQQMIFAFFFAELHDAGLPDG